MIGKVLKYMRNSNNSKQEEIALKINIKSNTLSQYENNNRQATFETIEKIASNCGFEIVFRNIKTKKEINVNDIDRKEF